MQRDPLRSANQEFWDELCGSDLARALAIHDSSAASLRRFDDAYFRSYPYLRPLVESVNARDQVLEVGLGYGTVGGALGVRAENYIGLDIAEGPVRLMRQRLKDPSMRGSVVKGSVLDLPFSSRSFDTIYAIGSLHHTGNLARALDEVGRVARPGGRATIMLYSRWSWRALSPIQWARYVKHLRRYGSVAAALRAQYDVNAEGASAPHIDFVSRRDVRRLLAAWMQVTIRARNLGNRPGSLDGFSRRGVDSLAESVLGQDLYIVATR